MIRGRKILDDNQVNWYSNESAVLNYQMLFENEDENRQTTDGQPEKSVEEQLSEAKTLLAKREKEWKKKVKEAREVAFAKGFEAGKKEGEEKAHDQIDQKISLLDETLKTAQSEWKNQQELLDPGLIDLAFELAESILGIPVENPAIRKKMEESLKSLFVKLDEQTKTVLNISESDFDFVKELIEKYALDTSIIVQLDAGCNPGEFEMETDQETVILNFRSMLSDYQEFLALPSWKQ